MDKKEKHVKENEGHKTFENSDQVANSLPAEGRERKRQGTIRVNKLWMWLGVLILIFILLYWLFSIGILGDMTNWFNG